MQTTFTTYADPADAFQAALETGGVRAGVAVMSDGAYLVCTARTARKYGWEFLGRVYALPASKRAPT
ncbi:hypothetical protein F3K02_16940 [Hydrogenophaga sp. D2P1]|uniref:Uncharacterized protein n=1 Tax=Hydrogenophaga aromaticivorans TaxID=2610898 RepID=A0A7Y8GXX8_9BURK|nr:hypothetical protein [Hydrogenophaga aromaticivorans]NWF46925.1 hypothetical protein [Hydrogenophaga aromaticivorans]